MQYILIALAVLSCLLAVQSRPLAHHVRAANGTTGVVAHSTTGIVAKSTTGAPVSSCPVTTCIRNGGNCNTTSTNKICQITSRCQSNNNPLNLIAGTCTAYSQIGDNCNEADPTMQCQDFVNSLYTPIQCAQNDNCNYLPEQMAAGDPCAKQTDCIAALFCVAGVCQGLTRNSACSTSEECETDSYCKTGGTCVLKANTGESCRGLGLNNDDEACVLGDVCGASGNCVKYFSGAIGQPCGSWLECPITSFCSFTTATAGTCTSVPTTLQTCDLANGNADCVSAYGIMSTCVCPIAGGSATCKLGQYVDTPCTQSMFTDLATCLLKYNCYPNIGDSRSCARTKCAAQSLCELSCLDTLANQDEINSHCYVQPGSFYCYAASEGSINMVGFLALLMLVVTLWF